MVILVVVAHPDDLELLFGGTAAKLVACGLRVTAVIMTDGSLGCPGKTRDQAAAIRADEAYKGCRILGVELLAYGLAPDGALADGPETRGELGRIIADVDPEVILTHWPDDYHVDHAACVSIIQGASTYSRVGRSAGQGRLCTPPQRFFLDTVAGIQFDPDFCVDISGFWARKEAALRAHQSQIQTWADRGRDLVKFAQIQAWSRGIQSGVEYAEAFRFHNAWLSTQALPCLPLTDLFQLEAAVRGPIEPDRDIIDHPSGQDGNHPWRRARTSQTHQSEPNPCA